jgi:hypothetical protein
LKKGEKIMKKVNFKEWIKAAAIRAIKTVAQTAVAIIGTSTIVTDVNWKIVACSAALAGIVSLLTSVAGLPELDKPEKTEKEGEGNDTN